ncbi:MAG: GldG family protein [Candidatus Omnitrophica bacterium]|nr:GldG family protein [Candidatus Omnitrophota bacterium]
MKSRNLFSSFHFTVLLSAAFLIALFGYFILRTYHYRFDFSEGKVYSLSPQSLQVLKALRNETIEVRAFFRDDQVSKQILEDLLKEYAYHHPKFHVQFYDPDRMPAKAKQYQVDAYETTVIEVKGRREKTKQMSEEAITNLLSKLLRQETKRITFATGHGGASLSEANEKVGYGLLRQKLIDSNYEVQETVLMRDGISKGTDLLVLGGPRVDLLPEEIQVIKKYLERGGNLLVLMDPVDSGEGKNLKQFLLEYGVELGDDVIVDKLSKLFGADYLIPLISEYRPHAITQGFRLTSFFPIARSVRRAKEVPGGFEITEIALTGSGSWAETNLKDLGDGKAQFDEKKDNLGPISVAVSVQKTKGKGRLVVFGDSDFVTNGYLNLSGNKDLILNTIAWLSGDDLAITTRPRARAATPLYLKETDQEFLFYVPVLGFPVCYLITGTAVFFWRRRFN